MGNVKQLFIIITLSIFSINIWNIKAEWIGFILFILVLLIWRKKMVILPNKLLFLLGVPLFISTLFALNNDLFNNIKGFFYLSIPLILFLIGYNINKFLTLNQFLETLIVIGVIVSIIYITAVLYIVGFDALLSPYSEARQVFGSGTPASILSFFILIYRKRLGLKLNLNKSIITIYLGINLLAVYLFASRNYWASFVFFLLIFNIVSIKRFALPILIVSIISSYLIINIQIDNNYNASNSLLYKISNSLKEVSIGDYDNEHDINTKYRGYEAFRALETYLSGNSTNLIFGHGLGKMIDLKTEVMLGKENRREIPWIHNGFFFVLVKEGVLGLIVLLIIFFKLIYTGFKNIKNLDQNIQTVKLLFISCIVSLIISNYTSCGFFTLEFALYTITISFISKEFKIFQKDKTNILPESSSNPAINLCKPNMGLNLDSKI